jgi:hypothetical protein
MTNILEYAEPGDAFFDFCLWEYIPAAPFMRKLRSASLLFHSFDVLAVDERLYDLIRAIRGGFGVSNTVWGIKKRGSEISWELYFYDYRKAQRTRSVSRFQEIVQPFVRCDLPIKEGLPYFMFSVDIDERIASGSRGLDEVHLYIGNTGSTVSSGICYLATKSWSRLENFYFFFDAKSQMDKIIAKATCSVWLDATRANVDAILWPELRDCSVIVVANKPHNDSLYFSRINLDQLLFFLKRMSYPPELWRFIEDHRRDLDHLLYDVGIDYRMEGNNLVVLKSGYYGVV